MERELLNTLEQIIPTSATFAIGNDLVFVPGFQPSLNELFIKKVYTPNEVAYCESFSNPLLRYASTWAAKEAVYKALKQLFPHPVGWKSIEISRKKAAGQPHVIIHAYPQQFTTSLTISHDGDYVWAAALMHVNS